MMVGLVDMACYLVVVIISCDKLEEKVDLQTGQDMQNNTPHIRETWFVNEVHLKCVAY